MHRWSENADMKQLMFMIPSLLIGTFGSFATHPCLGVLVYFLYAVLRPQFIWQWSLPEFNWSLYVALAAIVSTISWRMGVIEAEGHEITVETNAGHYTVYGFAFWIVVTSLTARHPDESYPFLIEYIKMFVMFLVARYAIVTISHLWKLFLVVTLTLCYISYEMNEIYLSTGYTYVYRKGYGGLDNNGAALMLAMGVPLCLYAWDGVKHWIRWGFILFIPAIIHAVMTSYSRGAMLSLILVTPIYLVRCRRRVQLLLILCFIGSIIPILAGKEIRERFFSINEHEVDDSANSRKQAWKIAIRMASECPIFGFGVRNSNLYTYAYGADMDGRAIHSQWLQIAADCGYVGIGLYASCFLAMFYCCARTRRSIRNRDDIGAVRSRIMINGCEGALMVFMIGASFLSLENFELPFILLLLCAQTLAVVESEHHISLQRS